MNPNRKLIDLYEDNRTSLRNAIESAGGASEIILARPEWREVMFVFATNNIRLSAEHFPQWML